MPDRQAHSHELRFENQETASRKQAYWKRTIPLFAAISYAMAAGIFLIVYLSSGYPPPAKVAEAASVAAACVAGVLSLALYSVGRMKAVSLITVNESGITLTTVVGSCRTLRWGDPDFRLVLWNRVPPDETTPTGDGGGVLNARGAFVGWPTPVARDTLVRVAREHGVRAWTWHPWTLYTVFPTSTLLAHRLSITDRLRGLKTVRPES